MNHKLVLGAKPEWLKKRINFRETAIMKKDLRGLGLHTVCEEASCPNQSECFARGTATVMILGDICTRTCKFCNVAHGRPKTVDENEPQHVAEFVRQKKLRHVVITSVDRDDLKDGGSRHFFNVVMSVQKLNPQTTIEVLTPDFRGETSCLDTVCLSPISIFNHNLETVRRITPVVRSVADYVTSLKVIAYVAQTYPNIKTKSGLMSGLGETENEIIEAMTDLRAHGCQHLTLGQYLPPSKNHFPVQEYIPPDIFLKLKEEGEKMGFDHVFSGPFVRSSYWADAVVA